MDWLQSPDGNLLVIRTESFDGTGGRLCAFDVSDPTVLSELGCHEYVSADAGMYLTVAFETE